MPRIDWVSRCGTSGSIECEEKSAVALPDLVAADHNKTCPYRGIWTFGMDLDVQVSTDQKTAIVQHIQ
jgi:hypothetical protein